VRAGSIARQRDDAGPPVEHLERLASLVEADVLNQGLVAIVQRRQVVRNIRCEAVLLSARSFLASHATLLKENIELK
jgi:hypothetical protein